MKRKEFVEALETLGLSNRKAATVLGVSRTTIIRHTHGKTDVPMSLQRLVAMLIKHGIPEEFAQ